MTSFHPAGLRVHTVEVEVEKLQTDLLTHVPADTPAEQVFSWIREGDGLVGWGVAAQHRSTGAGRFDDAEAWWQALVAASQVSDAVEVPGSGLASFGSFAFADSSPEGGVLSVPSVILGRRDGKAWVTLARPRDEEAEHTHTADLAADVLGSVTDLAPLPPTDISDGAVAARDWPRIIGEAVTRIESGGLSKVVLARDIQARADTPLPVTTMLSRLAGRYRATWTFAVHGLIGATPEMLVRLQHGQVRSRVLAGTVRRDHDPAPSVTEAHPELDATGHRVDPRLHLVSSAKELEEHSLAVASVAQALRPHCADLQVPAEPFVLELPDVYHLATDLVGSLGTGATSIRLAQALHPSAAVCGTPTVAAAAVIAELEGMDRGRYAGPVGWTDASGEGDWGIALRCGQLSPDAHTVRLFAGGGIMAASDPEAELAETELKFATMRHALDL